MNTHNSILKIAIFRQWYFWLGVSFIAAMSSYFSWSYLTKIYPLLNITISADKKQVELLAQALCKQYNIGPRSYIQTSQFVSDRNMEGFIGQNILFSENKDILRTYMKSNLYPIYTWQVRHFKEGNPKECLLKFSPEGVPYGFIEQISENDPGPALKEEEALEIAKDFTQNWNLNLEQYTLTESSHQERANGRVDYTFVFYQKPYDLLTKSIQPAQINNRSWDLPVSINDITYKLLICVYGSKVTALDHFAEIPEQLSTSYQPLVNEFNGASNLDSLVLLFIYILYFLLCFIGLILLIKSNYLIKNNAFISGTLVAFTQLIFQLSSLSTLWINYNISQSAGAYLINNILGAVIAFFFYSVFYSLIILIAEGSTRATFPQHIQFWKSWNKQVNNSPTFIGIISSSYLLLSISLATAIGLMFFSFHLIGWTYRSIMPLNANILGHSFPALSALAQSIHESFWQEMIMRAIPIACFTLIGQKLRIRRLGLFIGFIIQLGMVAITQTGYLPLSLISSFWLNLLYIKLGFISTIIIQFVYNTLFMALPFYKATAQSLVLQKYTIIIGAFTPIIMLCINLIKTGKIAELSDKYLNLSWKPIPNTYKETEEGQIPLFEFSTIKIIILVMLTALSANLFYKKINFTEHKPKFTITREQAIEKAKLFIQSKDLSFDSNWEILSKILVPNKSVIKFIWQKFGEDIYNTLNGSYIKHPAFEIKLIKFGGLHNQRMQEYTIIIDSSGNVESFQHILSEEASGRSLSENSANHLAASISSGHFQLDPMALQIISSLEIKRPERRDWIITIKDTSINFIGDAQAHIIVKICGDEVISIKRKIHTPQEWLSHKSKLDQFSIIFELLKELIFILFILIAFFQLLQSPKTRSTIIKALVVWIIYLGLMITNILLSIPEITAYLNTAKSFYFQIIYAECITIAKAIVQSLSILILTTNIFSKKNQSQSNLRPLTISSICLSIIASGLSIALFSFNKHMPISYSLESLNTYYPLAYYIISQVTLFISRTVTVLFIAQYAKFKFSLRTILSALAISLMVLSRIELKDLYAHLVVFAIIFLIMIIAHLAVIRYNTLLIPQILLFVQLAQLAQEFIADPFVDSKDSILLASGALIITILILIFLMKNSKKEMAQNS